jgi:hypothetical protein
MDSNHDKVIQSHLCYRYTTRQYKSVTTNNLLDCPTSISETLLSEHGVFQGPNIQEIFPSASSETKAETSNGRGAHSRGGCASRPKEKKLEKDFTLEIRRNQPP